MAINSIPTEIRTSKRDASFWRQVNVGGVDECWLWPESRTTPNGYGTASYGQIHTTAHRIAYMIAKGTIPDGLQVMHSCDVRRCVNPKHLLPGTAQDNTDDMIAKGRQYFPGGPSGEMNGNAKLSNSRIAEIHELSEFGLSQRQIARRLGVSKSQIGNILRGESRKEQRPSGFYWVKLKGQYSWTVAEWFNYSDDKKDPIVGGSWQIIAYEPWDAHPYDQDAEDNPVEHVGPRIPAPSEPALCGESRGPLPEAAE